MLWYILKKILYLLALSLAILFAFNHQAQAQEKEDVIELLHADSSRWNLEEDNVIISLFGDVQFKHGDVYLSSDRAIWYKTAEQIVFLGRVEVADQDISLSSLRLTYYQRRKKIVAEQNVRLWSKEEQVLITGQRGEYQREKKYAIFTQSPRLEIYPEKPESTIVVTADTLEYFADQENGFARQKVHIKKGDMDAFCDLAELSRGDSLHADEDKLFLKQNPRAIQSQNQISGDLMELHFKKRQIQNIIVYGNARASQREEDGENTSESYVTGDKISFLLEEEQLRQVQVEGKATSLYVPSSEDTTRKVRNEASGDTISLFLTENQLKRVLIKGGAIGTYYQTHPPNPGDTIYVTDTINYSAEDIDYLIEDSLIVLQNTCNLKFQTISLDAGKVEFYTKKEVLTAQGLLKMEGEKEMLTQLPVLKDQDEQITGKMMVYNIKTRRGKISAGRTEFQKGLYYGETLRKVDQKTILAKKGTYTTCDEKEPHYHFGSSKMKIIPGDKVIAKPIILYIKDIPVAAVPFYVFPTKPGRHSGFLTFDLGSFEANDRFIKNLGYYWAASEYWDLLGAFDLYESSGWMLKGSLRYAKRYSFSGTFSGSYNHNSSWTGFTRSRSTRWDLVFSHSHTISVNTNFSASGQFVSDKDYYKNFSFDPTERRNRSLHSHASLSTRWKNTGISIAVDRSENLDADTRTQKLPALTLTLPAFRPFGYSEKKQDQRWYQSLYLNAGSNLLNYSYKKENDEVSKKKYATFNNSISLQFPQNISSYISLSPSLNYQETWYYVSETDQSKENNIKAETLYRRGVPRMSLNASTKLFGTFYPKMGSVTGFRHVLSPTLSFSWSPEVKKNDPLLYYTGIGGSGGKQRTISLGLSQVFWIKTQKEDQEKKLELFNLSQSLRYNFVATTRKLSNLSTTLRSSAIPNIQFDLIATHDFYDPETNEIKKRFPRLVYFSLNTDIDLKVKGFYSAPTSADTSQIPSPETATGGLLLDISHRYSETKTSSGIAKTHWASLSTGIALTPNWNLSYVCRYDFEQEKITEQSFDLYRDLHCWEARFSWVLQGYRSGYYFKINIKSLPQVKIEKSPGGLREVFF